MSINWSAFFAVLVVAYAIPGPDFAVIPRQATRTRRSGVLAAVGAQTGLCLHMLLAVVGLSAVLARHPDALLLIRVLGGLYLLWLGASLVWKTRDLSTAAPDTHTTGEDTDRGAFLQGSLTNVRVCCTIRWHLICGAERCCWKDVRRAEALSEGVPRRRGSCREEP